MEIFLLFSSGIFLYYLSDFFPCTVAFLLLLATAASLKKKKPLWIFMALVAFLYASYRHEPPLEPFRCENGIMEAKVTGIPVREEYGYRQDARVVNAAQCTSGLEGKKIIIFSREPLPLQASGIFSADIRGTFPYRNPQNLKTGMTLSAHVKSVLRMEENRNFMWHIQRTRVRLLNFFDGEFGNDVAGFLDSVIAGDRNRLSDSAKKAFTYTGLSHLLSISGTHFGIFFLLISSSARFLLKRLPYGVLNRLTLYLKPSEAAALISIPFMIYYLMLSGADIPAIRSFIMINVFLLGFILGRKGAWKNSLSFAAFIMLLLSPDIIFDVSFMLSFSAVAAIGFAMEWRLTRSQEELFIPGLKETLSEKIKDRVLDIIVVTTAAFAGTSAVSLYLFHSFSMVTLLTNMIITPVVCFVIVPWTLLASLIFLITGYFPLASLDGFATDVTLKVVRFIADLPFSSLPVPSFPIILVLVFYLGLALIIPRKTRLHGAGLVVLCIIFVGFYPLIRNNAPVEMTFLDVGQGESAVISLPDKKTMVIDTGRDGKQTVSYLDYLGKKTVDALFLTHDGSDHAGGLGYIMTMKRVRAILDNGSIYYSGPLPADIQHISLKRGDVIDGTGYRIETLHPHDGFYSSHSSHAAAENNDCLVLRLRAAGLKTLFTGDIETEAEEDMITLGKYLNADILKVAHHGGRSSTTDDFLASADPSISVISSGMFNPYGHPHKETMRKLSGRKTFNTAECGAIKITARLGEDKKSFRYFIKTFEDYRLREAHNIQDEIDNLGKLVMTW